jgi:hypothetical protein
MFDPRIERDTWVGRAKSMRDRWGDVQFFCDPSKPDAINEFIRAGLNAVSAANDITYGVRKVAERLHIVDGKPRLRVLECCTNLIREKRAYVWDQKRGAEGFRDMPAPNQSDHALDAERYAVIDLTMYEPMPPSPSRSIWGGSGAGPIG